MSDVWEAAYGQAMVPTADADHDGFSNVAEATCGTDPHQAMSFPKVRQLDVQPQSLVQYWQSVKGVKYQPLFSADMRTWLPFGAPVMGTGGDVSSTLDRVHSFTTGGVDRSVWTGLEDWGLWQIKDRVETGAPLPSFKDRMTVLEVAQSEPDVDFFGQWIHGWIIPPETGNYQFWIASDDQSEFWLSTTKNAVNKVRVCQVSSWTDFQEWDKSPAQTSALIPMVADTTYYFEIYQAEGNGGDHLSVAWKRPSMAAGTREIIGGSVLSSTGQSLADLGNGRLFSTLEITEQDTDGDGVTDYEEGLLGLDSGNATTTPRVTDLAAAKKTLASASTVTLGVSVSRCYESSATPAEFTVFRAGGIAPITVNYAVGGTAAAGTDYTALPGSVVIPAGARSVQIPITPLADALLESQESVTITLQPGSGFVLGSPSSTSISIDDGPDVIFVAQLRSPAAGTSAGVGTAAVRRSGNAQTGRTSLSFSGLGTTQAGAEIFISNDGLSGPAVFTYPLNQVPGVDWNFEAAGGRTREQILDALNGGRLWVRILTGSPAGTELVGLLLPDPGWETMPAPANVPAPPVAATSLGEAARFLTQATFGPTDAALMDLQSKSFAQWIDAQEALPPDYHLPMFKVRRDEWIARENSSAGWQGPRIEAWWQHAVDAPDQLRQRMAFALSEIFVISQNSALDVEHEGTTVYYDMLLKHAFGNYRNLLEDVTFSPMMGTYLSMIRNKKPDPETGQQPDENYAREVMQLFSVGLSLRHTDGTLKLDVEGMPVPTYTQADTVGLAHVFTGWGAHYDPLDPPRWPWNNDPAGQDDWFLYGSDPLRPMSFYPNYHDRKDRTILGGVVIPGTLGGEERMRMALDTLFNHPNVGPFMARQLIQKFVTSNPSPGYIYRVASVFNNNGQGVRGDLGATIKAVLLDYEARSPAARQSISYGKPSEPLLRATRMLRAIPLPRPRTEFGDNRLFIDLGYYFPDQSPLNSPSVFNFYQPGFSSPGVITRSGLTSPEFQIFSETSAIRQANFFLDALAWGFWTSEPKNDTEGYHLNFDYSSFISILNTPGKTPAQAQGLLLDHLNDRLLFGAMTSALRASILSSYAALPGWFDYSNDRQAQRVQMAFYLILNSPEFFVQK